MSLYTCPKCSAINKENAPACVSCGAPLAHDFSADDGSESSPESNARGYQPGDVINGRYHVQQLIGVGGMGAIYRVLDKVMDEELALKVLLPQFVTKEEVVEQFINEVRITRKVAHPNIVRVHDIGTMGGGMFISMEYVRGMTLREVMDRLGPNEGLTIRQSVYIITQLCIALKYAHRYTVHLDIKPANVMVTERNHIKLMDFGISKLKDQRLDGDTLISLGTPIYMAPEQMEGPGNVDARADIYSLGVLFYEMLTRRLPAGIFKPPSFYNDDIPVALDAVILKCLEPNRNHRYNDVSELREALPPILQELGMLSSAGIASQFEASSSGISSGGDDDHRSNQASQINLAGVMEDFIREASSSGDTSGTSLSHESQATSSSAPEKELPNISLYTDSKPNYHSRQRSRPSAGWVAGAILGICLLILTVYSFLSSSTKPARSEGDNALLAETGKMAIDLMSQGGDLTLLLEKSLQELTVTTTPEKRLLTETLREHFLEEVSRRAYPDPFDIKALNSASNDIMRISHRDPDPRVQRLAEELAEEVAYFKFILTGIHPTQETATFRLNNSYIDMATQEVAVGDLLQDRFLVISITSRAVRLEDTKGKGAGRRLLARPMESVESD